MNYTFLVPFKDKTKRQHNLSTSFVIGLCCLRHILWTRKAFQFTQSGWNVRWLFWNLIIISTLKKQCDVLAFLSYWTLCVYGDISTYQMKLLWQTFMDTITKSIFKFYYGNQKNPFLFLSYISSIYDDDEILKGS